MLLVTQGLSQISDYKVYRLCFSAGPRNTVLRPKKTISDISLYRKTFNMCRGFSEKYMDELNSCKRSLWRLLLTYLASRSNSRLHAMGKSDKTTHVHDGQAEKSPGNMGLPGEKVGSHQSCTHLIHPGKSFVTSGKRLDVESLYQPKCWS